MWFWHKEFPERISNGSHETMSLPETVEYLNRFEDWVWMNKPVDGPRFLKKLRTGGDPMEDEQPFVWGLQEVQ